MSTLTLSTADPAINTYCEWPIFSRGNSKLPDSTLVFSLPSGYTCPGALACLTFSDRQTGALKHGPQQQFCCYAAGVERFRPKARENRWHNYDIVRHAPQDRLTDILLGGINLKRQLKTTHVRWFDGGDCFSVVLRDGIIAVAQQTPDLIHYFYTKNLPLFVAGDPPRPMPLPPNLRITASWGGKFDGLIEQGLFPRSARVLDSEQQAAELSLPIDETDYLAWTERPSHFCHLSHGYQRPGTPAAEAIRLRRASGKFTGYGSKRRSGEGIY